jgi:glycerophosphoryl diester phosphodiesterase
MIAHRGGVLGTHLYENSIEAFSRVMTMPFGKIEGIEFDLRRTKDNVFIIAHDPTLIIKSSNTHEHICELNFSQIREEYPNICTLMELLELSISLKYKGDLNIEIKEYNLSDDICSIITDVKYKELHFFITSFLHSEIQSFYHKMCYITKDDYEYVFPKIGYLFSSYPYNMENILSLNFDSPKSLFDAYIILNDKTLPRDHDHHLMQLLIKNSQRIYIYTVNDKDEISYYQKCGFHVITDNLL